MNDFYPNIIEEGEPTPKNRFPIVAQLGILGVFMVLIFGSWLVHTSKTLVPLPAPEPDLVTDTNKYPITPQKIEEVSLRAKGAYVWDVKGQRALYSKNADQALPLASITKLMTTLLTYELVSEDNKVSVPLSAILQEGSSGLSEGEELTTEELTQLALISSSNDAAYSLAASVGSLLGKQDPASQFVEGMNIRAGELGLNTLRFKNPTGLDVSSTEPGAVGSARDVSFLMEYIITNYPTVITPTQQSAARIYNTAGAYHEANNTNEVVLKIPNMIGSKTGYTDLAGGNLTIAFDAGLDRPIIITVLGSTYDERFSDVLTLVDAVQKSLTSQ
ncbi:D-alanyl-D-alanine carboxypeptidase [Candidatus Nomurabacteria bacterium]|nr:D-alanyl-D-alanine carboxypeptidase [Candidatus Nomurabacteria bacterium]